jgi:hypothetical protein
MQELILNGPVGDGESATITVIPLKIPKHPLGGILFKTQGEALAAFISSNIYSGTYDEMMKNFIRSEIDSYANRDKDDDPEAMKVAEALTVFWRRLVGRCNAGAAGPGNVDLDKKPSLD